MAPDAPTLAPHLCFSGVALSSLNNAPIGLPTICDGYCSNVTVGGISIYSCDPIAVCASLGVNNSCVANEDGLAISACCCDGSSGDSCNTPDYTGPTPIPDLQCYSGAELFSNGIT